MVLLNLYLSPDDAPCAIPKHVMVLYTISTAAYFSKFLGIDVLGSSSSQDLYAFARGGLFIKHGKSFSENLNLEEGCWFTFRRSFLVGQEGDRVT